MSRRAWLGILACGAAAAAMALAAVNLLRGDLNQDEGWYLYAAGLVAHGQLPYVDFASTQGPVMPFVYALGQPLVERFGVAGGRLFTALLGLAGVACAAWLAARLAPPRRRGEAALLALCLAGVNVYHSYFCTIVKTYALTGLLLMGGFLALSAVRGRRGAPLAALGGALFMLATGTRLSAAAVLPAVFGVLCWGALRARGAAGRPAGAPPPLAWLWFGAGAVLTALLIYLPFLLAAPQALWFALVEYHAGREAGAPLAKLLAYKAGFVARVVQAYFVPVALASAALVMRLAGPRRGAGPGTEGEGAPRADPAPPWLFPALGWSVFAVTLLHMAAPFPYDDYQVLIAPAFCAALAVGLARRPSEPDPAAPPRLAIAVALLCVLAAGSSPVVQSWFIGQRDRIWWPLKSQAPLAVLQETARRVRQMEGVRPGETLLTQDPYLAVEAGLKVPRGLELGPFSYFPDWPREKAAACRVVNREMLLTLLDAAPAPVAAFSGYGLAIRSPAVVELAPEERAELRAALERRYRPAWSVKPFGQADTTLEVFRRRPAAEDAPAGAGDEE